MIPLILLVGFLGAGKTTLLRELVPRLRAVGEVPGVILNDYLNARVDAATLAGLAEDVIPITGTCVCCDSRGELMAALREARGRPLSAMLVEANGTADAAELIEALVADPAAADYTLPVQVAVVDARRWQRRAWHDELEASQVTTASYLCLSRLGQVNAERRRRVERELAALAPRATVVDPPALAEAIAALAREAPGLAPRRFAARAAHRHGHDHGRHHFSALEVPLPGPVAPGALEDWLRELPPQVTRAKGVARLESGSWVYFERLQERDSVALAPIPSGDLDPVAVLIGVDLSAVSLDALRRC